jgi:tRNA pseudouridine55 synthase
MSREPGGPPRLLCIDKPDGMTSFDVVRRVRHVTGYRRVGHAGTLDPFATGVLVLGLGPATRLMRFLAEGSKVYEATVFFGSETDSEDRTGTCVRESARVPVADEVQAVLAGFTGRIQQVPPRLSAIHIDGERSYRRARRGEEVELPVREVFVHELELVGYDLPRARLRISCGGGTYIRSLARDLGRVLDSAAHLEELRRTEVGDFGEDRAVPLDEFEEYWQSGGRGFDPSDLVGGWPCLRLDAARVTAVRQGAQPDPEWWSDEDWVDLPERVALLGPGGALIAIATPRNKGSLRLACVLPEPG